MFSLKSKYIVQNNLMHRLPAYPGLAEFHFYVDQALASQGRWVEVTWRGTKNEEYFSLGICSINGLKWQLQAGTSAAMRVVLEYVSGDVLLLYNLVASACGEGERSIDAAGAVSTAGVYRDLNGEIFYVRASDSGTDTPALTDKDRQTVSSWSQAFQSSNSRPENSIDCSAETPAPIWQSDLFETDVQFLQSIGWKERSILVRQANSNFSAMPVDDCDGDSSNFELMRRFYECIDGRTTARLIGEHLGLPREEWIPILRRLITSNLILICGGTHQYKPAKPSLPAELDAETMCEDGRESIDSMCRSMKSTLSGLFVYPAFLMFLDQEKERAKRYCKKFTLITFKAYAKGANGERMALPPNAVREMLDRVHRLKRSMDILAHFKHEIEYALILPETSWAGAAIFGSRLVDELRQSPLCEGISRENFELVYSIVVLPEDDPTAKASAPKCGTEIAGQEQSLPTAPYLETAPVMFAGVG